MSTKNKLSRQQLAMPLLKSGDAQTEGWAEVTAADLTPNKMPRRGSDASVGSEVSEVFEVDEHEGFGQAAPPQQPAEEAKKPAMPLSVGGIMSMAAIYATAAKVKPAPVSKPEPPAPLPTSFGAMMQYAAVASAKLKAQQAAKAAPPPPPVLPSASIMGMAYCAAATARANPPGAPASKPAFDPVPSGMSLGAMMAYACIVKQNAEAARRKPVVHPWVAMAAEPKPEPARTLAAPISAFSALGITSAYAAASTKALPAAVMPWGNMPAAGKTAQAAPATMASIMTAAAEASAKARAERLAPSPPVGIVPSGSFMGMAYCAAVNAQANPPAAQSTRVSAEAEAAALREMRQQLLTSPPTTLSFSAMMAYAAVAKAAQQPPPESEAAPAAEQHLRQARPTSYTAPERCMRASRVLEEAPAALAVELGPVGFVFAK
jgi:hypothetical protein